MKTTFRELMTRTGVALKRLVLRLWYRCFWNWTKRNLNSLKQLTWGLYQYRFGWCREHRKHMTRTKARWFAHRPLWVSVDWISAPEFRAAVCDGMGEHYGYPRHYAYVILWWNHQGYAWGVEFNPQNNKPSNFGDNTTK